MRQNKTIVKLDLSKNGLKSVVAMYLLEALHLNCTVMELNLEGNMLDDEFAKDLAVTLTENEVLNKVDISDNPIGPDGALSILNTLL